LLKEGTDLKYGARHLKRAIERHVVYPLANLLATDQVHLGDVVCIDWDQPQGCLAFTCEAEGAVLPMPTVQLMGMAMAAEAKGGRQVEVPSTIAARETRASAAPPAQLAPAPSRRSRA
jgi:hypothetical protein